MGRALWSVCGLVLLGASSPALAADNATLNFTKALSVACQPWMEGAERKALSAKLQGDGWNATADALFSKSGSWGQVMVSLQQSGGDAKPGGGNWLKTWVEETHGTGKPPAAVKRECHVQLSSNDEPWSTEIAVTAAAAWIGAAFPKAEKKNSAIATVGGQQADATLWSGGNFKITQIVYQAKQTPPNSDVLLKVENE